MSIKAWSDEQEAELVKLYTQSKMLKMCMS